MSNWFFAANGQQQGPYPEAQFRDLIGNGTVRADTLVWTEGMAGWQKAGEVPGLVATPPGPPTLQHGAPPMMAGGASGAPAVQVARQAARWWPNYRSGVCSDAQYSTPSACC